MGNKADSINFTTSWLNNKTLRSALSSFTLLLVLLVACFLSLSRAPSRHRAAAPWDTDGRAAHDGVPRTARPARVVVGLSRTRVARRGCSRPLPPAAWCCLPSLSAHSASHPPLQNALASEHRTLGTTHPPALVLGSTLSSSSLASHFSVFAVSLAGLLVFPQGSLLFTHHQSSPLHPQESTGHELVHIGLTTDTRRPPPPLTTTEQAAILPATGFCSLPLPHERHDFLLEKKGKGCLH